MANFSRHIPPRREPNAAGVGFWAPIVAGFGTLAYFWPLVLIIVKGIWAITSAFSLYDRIRDQRIAASRPGESAATFARDCGCRNVDPWVIRAVYEELSFVIDNRFPIRANDRLCVELPFDELDAVDALDEIAYRAGRTWGPAHDELFEQVRTAKDLVLFFNELPRSR